MAGEDGDALRLGGVSRNQPPRQSWLRSLAPSLAVTHPRLRICLLVSKRTARVIQDAGGAMPSLNHSSRVCGVIRKKAGEFFQAQTALRSKNRAQEPDYVIAVFLA